MIMTESYKEKRLHVVWTSSLIHSQNLINMYCKQVCGNIWCGKRTELSTLWHNPGCPLSFETGGTMGYHCCFFLNFVPLHIESPYNFGGTGPIFGVKNPLQRVNGNADNLCESCQEAPKHIRNRHDTDKWSICVYQRLFYHAAHQSCMKDNIMESRISHNLAAMRNCHITKQQKPTIKLHIQMSQ
jgi:hypothetical protein